MNNWILGHIHLRLMVSSVSAKTQCHALWVFCCLGHIIKFIQWTSNIGCNMSIEFKNFAIVLIINFMRLISIVFVVDKSNEIDVLSLISVYCRECKKTASLFFVSEWAHSKSDHIPLCSHCKANGNDSIISSVLNNSWMLKIYQNERETIRSFDIVLRFSLSFVLENISQIWLCIVYDYQIMKLIKRHL